MKNKEPVIHSTKNPCLNIKSIDGECSNIDTVTCKTCKENNKVKEKNDIQQC